MVKTTDKDERKFKATTYLGGAAKNYRNNPVGGIIQKRKQGAFGQQQCLIAEACFLAIAMNTMSISCWINPPNSY